MFPLFFLEIISNKLRDQNWASLLSLISPDEYGSIIAHVNLDMDQPRVAEVLANNMSRFTCEHVRAAAKNAADWGRATMVQRVLPYCVDVVDNHGMLQEGLTLWEQTITNGDFERAICERDRR